MATYSFSTELLSAQKTGNPNLSNTTLSGVGVYFLSGASVPFTSQNVVVVSLSTEHVGIAFNPVYLTVGATSLSTFNLTAYPPSDITVAGSVFTIPNLLTTSTMAVIKTNGTTSLFAHNSAYTTTPLSSFSFDYNVSTPNTRRLRYLGYK